MLSAFKAQCLSTEKFTLAFIIFMFNKREYEIFSSSSSSSNNNNNNNNNKNNNNNR